MCFYPSLSCQTFSQIFVLSPLVYNHVTHHDVCVDSSAAQRIVGEKSKPACTLQNVTGHRRRSWYFWPNAFYKLCNLGHDRDFSGTLNYMVASVLEGRESIYTCLMVQKVQQLSEFVLKLITRGINVIQQKTNYFMKTYLFLN